MRDNIFLFTEEEQSVVSLIVADFSNRAKKPFSLDSLIQKWSNFTISVERGYQYSIYDYTNDLGVRDLLEEIINLLPISARKKIMLKLERSDERFVQATVKSSVPILGHGNKSWWYRIPKKLEGELKEDFLKELL